MSEIVFTAAVDVTGYLCVCVMIRHVRVQGVCVSGCSVCTVSFCDMMC